MSWINKDIFFSLLLLLITLFLSVFFFEVTLRFFNIGYGNAPLESDPKLHHSHPVNYKFRSHNPTGEYGGHMIYYDENGLRIAEPSGFKKNVNDSCRIAFLGDSYTEAVQVGYEQSFVGLLDSQTECIVKNYGVSSYSPIMYLLQWQFIEDSFNPTHIFVQLFSNDMDGDERYFAIAEKDEFNNVIAVPGPGSDWIRVQLRKSYLIRFIRKTQLKLKWIYENYKVDNKQVVSGIVEEVPILTDLSRSFIQKLNDNVVASGSKFILFVVPSKYNAVNKSYDTKIGFSNKISDFSNGNNIEFINLDKAFKNLSLSGESLFFEKDIHFNEKGHSLVADIIAKQYPKLFQ